MQLLVLHQIYGMDVRRQPLLLSSREDEAIAEAIFSIFLASTPTILPIITGVTSGAIFTIHRVRDGYRETATSRERAGLRW